MAGFGIGDTAWGIDMRGFGGLTRRAPRLMGLLALVVAAGVATPADGSSSSPTADPVPVPALPTACAAPFGPGFTYPADGASPARGDNLEWNSGPIDTDGDGVPDVVTVVGVATHIGRTGGSLDLPDHAGLADREHPVDLDGDGGTDLIVLPLRGNPAAQTGPQTAYLVPGSTASGPVDVEAAGIRLPKGFEHAQFVGDRDGDGAGEVAVEIGTRTAIFSGVDLTAPGPGGTFAGDPIEELDGVLIGRVPFDPSVPALITSPDATDAEAGRPVTLVVHTDPELVLTTAGSPLVLPPYSPDDRQAAAMLLADGSQVWIVLGQQSRGGGSGWVWELTDLCPAPAAPTAAPAAEPIAATASYTG